MARTYFCRFTKCWFSLLRDGPDIFLKIHQVFLIIERWRGHIFVDSQSAGFNC
jgi:hypothetical protein